MPQQRIPIRTDGSLRQQFVLEAGRESYIRSEQDCNAIVDANKRASNDFVGTTKHGTAIAARVPAIYRYVKWPLEFQMKYGVHPDRPPPGMKVADRMAVQEKWAKFYKSKLNDRDFRHFRTDGGRKL